jgi:hypothetical protein
VTRLFNVYCDESCHLEKDRIPVMVLGSVWCPTSMTTGISRHLRSIKTSHGLARNFEVKWGKVSPGKLDLYLAIIDYFFTNPALHFRCVVVPDKAKLDHDAFGQSHDDFYYKMWFVLLKQILHPKCRYRIYLDIKDTRGQEKVEKLHEVLSNASYDFNRQVIERIQQVRSHEVEILQLADLMIGTLAYVHRGLGTSKAKLGLVERVRERSGLSLLHTTLPKAEKVNLLVWQAQEW